MAGYYLNSYKPLVVNRPGRLACQEFGLPPFIDGSIRREPDLEHTHPSISCLCRAGKFAPRLDVGDVVSYMTCKVRFGYPRASRRLTALLRVEERLPDHDAAAAWFRGNGMALPSNVMIDGNPPQPLCRSHCFCDGHIVGRDDARAHRRWDAGYRMRATKHRVFLVCHAIFLELTEFAPVVTDDHLRCAFGKLPGTQNPGKLSEDQFWKLMEIVGVRARPSAP